MLNWAYLMSCPLTIKRFGVMTSMPLYNTLDLLYHGIFPYLPTMPK
jgi:hypothetical protein